MKSESEKGLWYALACYVIWGTFPLYWYPLNHSALPAEQMLAQRIVWSAIFASILLLVFRQGASMMVVFRQPKLLASMFASAVMIGANWLIYLWAIMNHHVLDASLGYFMNPLFNVFLGWLVFKDKLNRTQGVAIALAMMGVGWLSVWVGQIPWVSLLLALSFGCYALIRKLVHMDALPGLALETLLLTPFALAYLAWCMGNHTLVFGELNALQLAVLCGSGVATTLPLLAFAAGAKRISLSLLGILQYISPTMQLMFGLTLFGEQFDVQQFIGYVWVWLGVAVFLLGAWQQKRT